VETKYPEVEKVCHNANCYGTEIGALKVQVPKLIAGIFRYIQGAVKEECPSLLPFYLSPDALPVPGPRLLCL
jgi:hypothetical protein